ncbi:MAG: CHAT domain-containing protein, partial [Chloroflexi bacterium]|nr:CHAT domain-containing protein [Chloroflexota bacterium]
MTAYADLEIRIFARQDQGYPVEITLNKEQQFGAGYLQSNILPWVPGVFPAEDGVRLFELLFADSKLKAAWVEARGRQPQRRVRLRFDATAPELHAIPWELLRDTEDGSLPQDLAAATATPFSRYLAGKWQPGGPILQRPIKILVAIADPTNLASDYKLAAIDAETEWAGLQAATAGLDVKLVRLPAPCTLSALESKLKEGFHALHFIGHGRYYKQDGKAVLYIADADNRVQVVSDAEFAAMLDRQLSGTDLQQDDKLRLVFLASCQTATVPGTAGSPADAFRGFAPALVAAGVPAVLAMQDLIGVDTARAFARTFYGQLLQDGLVDLACNQARAALMTARLPGAAIPVLFMRLPAGELLGKRGYISTGRDELLFWPFLLENIDRGQCIPFLGPRVNANLLPSTEDIAERLADRYGYPLLDRNSLARVAQFMADRDPDLLHSDYFSLLQRSLFTYLDLKPSVEQQRALRRPNFTQAAEALNWAEKVLEVQENEIHHLLAGLGLPLYITTNHDNFMVEALKYRKLEARRAGPRWEPQAGSPQYLLPDDPDPDHGCMSDLGRIKEDDRIGETHFRGGEEMSNRTVQRGQRMVAYAEEMINQML